jgi:ElaB/YqjD/DUF883 family membrane-anchored ribosome-binding protein
MERQYDTHDEATFLQQQAADAQVAVRQTLVAMQETAKSAADIGAWTREYPWYGVGVAAVAGFLTATMVLSPARHQSHDSRTQTASASPSSFMSSVLSFLWRVSRGMLLSAVVSAMGVSAVQAEAADGASMPEETPMAE